MSYEVTALGKQIAHESGLEGLPQHLLEIEYNNPLLVQLTDKYAFQIEDPEEIETTAIQKARTKLKTEQEISMFERGLYIDRHKDWWRRTGELAKDTLFPNHIIDQFTPATEDDNFVLSGIVGLQLVDFRQRCHLLARSRYQEYSFKSFNESCAFVGAYVIAGLSEDSREKLYGNTPSFTYVSDGVSHKIMVGGTIHGDFRMSETRTLSKGIISPINTETEFSPRRVMNVSAYHSVEPDVVESMLLQELQVCDKQGLTGLVNEFIDVFKDLHPTLANLAREAAGNPFDTGFADYGTRDDIDDTIIKINLLLEGKLRRDRDALFATIVFPIKSDIRFEIISLENGIRLQNTGYYDEDHNEITPFIDINRQHFGDLFKTLLLQTQAALGRTSPQQLIKLIFAVKKLLDN